MKIAQDYHSGLRPEDEATPVHHVTFNGGIAFVHDIKDGFPKQFAECDVIYSEPPWKVGFREFNERAGSNAVKTHELLCGLIANAIMASAKPVYLVVGHAARIHYPIPDHCVEIRLHGAVSFLLVYRGECPETHGRMHSEEVIGWLASKYNRVGDFCCGYGQTGRIFVKAGRECVLCDYNPKCIGHIATNAVTWRKQGA